MNGMVREWLDKADGDFETAKREAAVTSRPNHDAVCFHAQQCVEKLMKAALTHAQVVPPKTHDLMDLSARLAGPFPLWAWDAGELQRLTTGAVSLRYPLDDATPEEAAQAVDACRRLREALLPLLDQPPPEAPAGTPPGGG